MRVLRIRTLHNTRPRAVHIRILCPIPPESRQCRECRLLGHGRLELFLVPQTGRNRRRVFPSRSGHQISVQLAHRPLLLIQYPTFRIGHNLPLRSEFPSTNSPKTLALSRSVDYQALRNAHLPSRLEHLQYLSLQVVAAPPTFCCRDLPNEPLV